MKAIIKFFKNSEFTKWKVEQLYYITLIFVILLSFIHSFFLFPEITKLHSINKATLASVSLICIFRLLPLILLIISHFAIKKSKVFTHAFINNIVMLLVVLFTALTKIFISNPHNPTGLILLDSIIVILSSMFSIVYFSILNFIICLIIVACLCINTTDIQYTILLNLAPLGFILCAITFVVDAYFQKTYKYINKIKKLVVEDNLTGLYNRNILKEKVFDKSSECFKYSGSMIMVDIDHFKNINDTYGHQTGDIALCRLAAVLNDNIRKDDYIIRFGGEEFLIIFKNLTVEECLLAANRVREQVENMNFEPHFTVSCGVTYFDEGELFQIAAKRSDDKLYEAKMTGRNKVCF